MKGKKMNTTSQESKSIIPEKYRGKYKTPDFIGQVINKAALEHVIKEKITKTKNDDGTESVHTEFFTTKKTQLNLDKLFALCSVNSIDYSEMAKKVGQPNAAGRIRMTLGNQLRSAARNRHGLFDHDGNWVDAPADFLGDAPLTQNRDGSKIVKEKSTADADADGDGAEDEAT